MARILMEKTRFATAINCIDGRVQSPVCERVRERFGVEYVDMITEPGADKVVALGGPETIDSIKQKVVLSIEGHHSSVVAVVAHHDCLANPVSRKEHLDYIKQSVERVVSWGLPVRVIGLWVNEWWRAEIVLDTGWRGSSEESTSGSQTHERLEISSPG